MRRRARPSSIRASADVARRDAYSRSPRAGRLQCLRRAATTRRARCVATGMADVELERRMSGRATSFYFSFLALPQEKRRAIVAVWDFCRAADDAVDESAEGTAACALAGWRAELKTIYEGQPPATPQGRQLMPYVARFNLP